MTWRFLESLDLDRNEVYDKSGKFGDLFRGSLEDIRALLASDQGIDQQQTIIVNFDNFGSYSLDIYLSCYTRTCDWAEYHACRERILLAIGAIINQRHADFAFPTSTLWLNQDQPTPNSHT